MLVINPKGVCDAQVPVFSTIGRGPKGQKGDPGDVGMPKFSDEEWSIGRSYEALTVVSHDGDSYTAKQDVPVGIEITDTEYWAHTGSYDAQVEQYRQETAAAKAAVDDIGELLPIEKFNTSSTVHDRIANVRKGFVGVSATLQDVDPTRRANIFYTDDFKSFHFIDTITDATNVDSSKIVKLGNFYYIWFGRIYYVSNDFINWTRGELHYVNPYNPAADAISSYRVWACQPMEYMNEFYITAAIAYNDNTFRNACNNNTYNFRPGIAPLVQDENTGLMSVGSFTILPNFYNSMSSWIDPWIIYSKIFNRYYMAIKNEDDCKIHIYSGTSINDLTEVSVTNYVFGTEGCQLFESENSMYLLATAYDLNGYSSAEKNYSGGIPYLTMVAKLTDRFKNFITTIKWNVIKTPFDLRHVGIMPVDENIASYINDIGYDAYEGHYFHGELDTWRVVINSTFNNTVDIVNVPNLRFGLVGDGFNDSDEPITLNYLPAFSGVITPIYSDSNDVAHGFKLGGHVSGSGRKIVTEPYKGAGFFVDYYKDNGFFVDTSKDFYGYGDAIQYQSLFTNCFIGGSGATIRTHLPVSKGIDASVSSINITVSSCNLICNGSFIGITQLIQNINAVKHDNYIEVTMTLSDSSSTAALNNYSGSLNFTGSVSFT